MNRDLRDPIVYRVRNNCGSSELAAAKTGKLVRLVREDLQERVPGLLLKGYVQRLSVRHHRRKANQASSGKILDESDLVQVDNAVTERNEFFHSCYHRV